MNRIHLILLSFLLFFANTFYGESNHAAKRVLYNHPGLIVDLGVGLWAVPYPVDWDLDGDNDLLVSTADVPYKGMYLFENDGSDVFLSGKRLDTAKHNLTISYLKDGFVICEPGKAYRNFRKELLSNPEPIPYKQDFYAGRAKQWKYADFDGDGLYDLLFGISDWRDYGWDNAFDAEGNWTRGPIHGYVYWAKNVGSQDNPQYEKAVKIDADGRPIDVFGCPSPNLVDWDQDGDLDLICGEFMDGITFFENIGSRTEPKYAKGEYLRSEGHPIRMDLQMLQVVVFDWDQDGDVDIIVGQEDGRVAWIENRGMGFDGIPVLSPPKFFKQRAHELKCGALTTPCSVDWDGDGDEDLICGNTAGYIEWIENLDGANPPKWAAPKRLEADGDVIRYLAGENGSIQGSAEAKWGYTVPYAADWDMDGLPDILVNTIIGRIEWFRNVGTRSNPVLAEAEPVCVEWPSSAPKPSWNWWNPKPGELAVQWRTRPVVLDWNRDGLNDLIAMDHEGFLCFFQRKRENGALITLPGQRIFLDEEGKALNLSGGEAGKSGRRKLDLTDWDGDGDFDMLINSPGSSPTETRNIAYYENISNESNQVVFKYQGDITSDRLEGHTTCPTTCDWDQDGIRELLVGAEDGFLYHYSRTSLVSLDHADWESAYADSNGIRLHYWRTGGEGKPVMIMAHGITDYGLNWTSLAEKFQEDYDIIMYDARGHGFSDKPDGPYDLATHVEDLVGLINTLGVKKPILIGHSMGGGTVALTAATYTDLSRAVILEDPADMLKHLSPLDESIIPQWKKMIEADKAMDKDKLIEMARTKRHPGWPDIEYERWAESKRLVIPNVVDILSGKGFGDAKETYSKITVPTLILKADAKENERKKHLELASLLPNGKLVHVDGAGHLIRLDKPEVTVRLIREFLAGLD